MIMETTISTQTRTIKGRRAIVRREKNSQRVTSKAPRLPEFKPVTKADMAQIWEILKREQGRTTDFSYGGLLMWVNYFNYEFAILNNTLFIRGVVENDRSLPAFSLPVGEMPMAESIALIREYCRRHNIRTELSAVPEYAVDELRRIGASTVEPLDDWADYLYEAEKLATLSGKKMAKKRNHVNRFDSLYSDWSLEELTPQNATLAMDFMDLFDEEGDNTPSAVAERSLTRELISHILAGDEVLRGALLMVGGKVAGFTIGDVKGDTLYVHVEKCTRQIEGSYEKINREFAAEMMRRYPQIIYINREDDAGDSGLRLAKESYHPIEKLKKFNVVFDR